MKGIERIKILRDQIDTLDADMIEKLGRRQQIVDEIGKIKKEESIPALQQDRWNRVMETLKIHASDCNLNETLIEDIWNKIHQDSLDRES